MKSSYFFAALLLIACSGAAFAAPKQPTFFARRDYIGLGSYRTAVADTNGDGFLDVIAISGGLDVLLGNGKGSFQPLDEGPLGMQGAGTGFVVTDLNLDGRPDIVISGQFDGTPLMSGVGVRLGNGDGTFQPLVAYSAGSDNGVSFVAAGDFNGDGIPDVVTPGTQGVWLFTGKRDGTLDAGIVAVPFPEIGGGRPIAVDFNGDGKLDLAITVPYGASGLGGGFDVALGNGDGTFQPLINYPHPISPLAIATGDLNGDGHPDLVMNSLNSSSVYVFLGNGKGAFSGPKVFNLPFAVDIAVGDVNGDGVPDLVTPGVYIALGKGDGTFGSAVNYTVDGTSDPFSISLASLRNNGRLDIVAGNYDSVSVLLSEGKGRFLDGLFFPVAGGAGCGAGGDFNGDGKPDLAVNNTTGITILLGTGNGFVPYSTGSTIPLVNAGCLITGDLNGDGIPDLVVPTPTSVIAYLANGDGTFRQSTSLAISPGQFVTLGDFNRDGKLDLATCSNLLALGNGDGTFGTPAPFAPPPNLSDIFTFVAVGDLNNDGWPDIVGTDYFESYIFILLNDQHGGFTETSLQVLSGYGIDPTTVALADLNGDGNLDALVPSIYGGAGIYLGDGKGHLKDTGRGFSNTLFSQNPLIVADVNGDGIPDAVLLEANTVAIYLGDGGGLFQTSPIGYGAGPSPGFILAQDLHGQSPGAGIPDIVVPDGSGGVAVLINTTK